VQVVEQRTVEVLAELRDDAALVEGELGLLNLS
jgi:hypothetical protein